MILVINHFLIVIEAFLCEMSKKNDRKKIFIALTFFQLFLLLALRGKSVGTDTHTYHRAFLYIAKGASVGFEVGDVWLIRILYSITHSQQFILSFYAFVTLLCMYYAIVKLSTNVCLSIIMYEGLLYYNFTFTGIRQALAIGIIMVAYVKLLEKKRMKAIIVIILATLFHTSAVIALFPVVYDCIKERVKMKYVYTIWICFFLFLLFFTNRIVKIAISFFPEYEWYTNGYEVANSSGINLLLYLLLFSYCVWSRRKKIYQKKWDTLLVILGLGVATYVMAIGFGLMNRVSLYYTCACIILIPNLLQATTSEKNRRYKKGICVLGVTLYFLCLIYTESNNVVPYLFFWE